MRYRPFPFSFPFPFPFPLQRMIILCMLVPALAGAAPQSPSEACAGAPGATNAEAAFSILLASADALEQVQLVSRHRFLPVDAEAEMCAVQPYVAGVRYRVFVSDTANPAKMTLVPPGTVWAENIPEGSTAINACTTGDRGQKTLIHFAPPASGAGTSWGKTQVHVLACGAGAIPLQLGQLQTNITSKNTCRVLAVLLCVAFYLVAAWSSRRIHQAGRYYKDGREAEARNLKGTNYASFWQHLDPVVLTANQNGRGSATKLQILFFSMLVFGVVAYIWMSTGTLSELSVTILALMGPSGVGATAAAATEVSRKRLTFENWAWLINRHWLPPGGTAEVNRAQWKDIFMTNSEFDVFRFQMITFSVLVGLSLLSAGGATADLSDFKIPEAFLGILGLSQVVYVAGKLVDGPSVAQLDEQIDTLRAAETTLKTALAGSAGMSDARGLPLDRNDLSLRVGDAYDKYIETWNNTRTMFQSTLSESVSAVAEGVRPPFPYLSLPADALAALKQKHAELAMKMAARLASLTGPEAAPGDDEKAASIRQADQAYLAASSAADKALADFEAAQQRNAPGQSVPGSDKDVRAALDQLRQCLAQLERLLAA